MQLFDLIEQLADLNDQVVEIQTRLKSNLETTKDAKAKKVLSAYNKDLEDIRATLLATKQKSMFADEERIRENLSEIFAAVANNEGRPTDSHLQRMEGLKSELEKAKESFVKVQSKYASKVPDKMLGAAGK